MTDEVFGIQEIENQTIKIPEGFFRTDSGNTKPLVTYRVCLNCGNRRGLYWEGCFIMCPICNRPYGSEIK